MLKVGLGVSLDFEFVLIFWFLLVVCFYCCILLCLFLGFCGLELYVGFCSIFVLEAFLIDHRINLCLKIEEEVWWFFVQVGIWTGRVVLLMC